MADAGGFPDGRASKEAEWLGMAGFLAMWVPAWVPASLVERISGGRCWSEGALSALHPAARWGSLMTASGYNLDNLFTGECCCVLCQEDQKSIWTSGLFGFYSLSSWQVACNCLVDELWLFCTSFLLPIMVYVDYC